MVATVLVVEDEVKIRDLLRSYFEREGYSVLSTGSGAEAIEMTRATSPNLVVLDLRLPDVAGETVAGEIRLFSNVPVLMLTAKSAELDRIRGLELGADDYVTKPFSPREVVLRAQAILRRTAVEGPGGPVGFGLGELVIDEDRRTATVRGEPVELTPTEWGVLVAVARVPGRVYPQPLDDAPDVIDDAVDDLIEIVELMGGTAHQVPAAALPPDREPVAVLLRRRRHGRPLAAS